MAFIPPYLKTKIGQHDFHKKPCFEYCKLNPNYCPFDSSQLSSLEIKRWTDLMDERLSKGEGKLRIKANSNSGYEDSPRDAELSQGCYSCWGDGSGFEYDIMSRNIIGQGSVVEHVYDISRYGINHEPLKFSDWNAWIDKFQYDYRFGRVSDTNAECILFPNVDNPWMFTEYVFQGVSGNKDVCALNIPTEYVVQPPIYDPQTLILINGDFQANISEYDGKYEYQVSDKGNGKVKQFREIINWYDLLTHPNLESNPNDSAAKRYVDNLKAKYGGQFNYNAGVKLYRVKVPVQSVKWGEHGNIPPHTLDMTAPKDWLDPQAGIGKLKAVYDAHVGSPLYAPFDGYVAWGHNEQFPHLAGKRQAFLYGADFMFNYDGIKKRYDIVPSGVGQEVDVPKQWSGKPLIPDTIVMGQSADQNCYCHMGCALCQSKNSQLTCSYIESLQDYQQEELKKYNDLFNSIKCTSKNTECPQFVPSNQRLLATYQLNIVNSHQTSMNLSKGVSYAVMGMAGGIVGASVSVDLMSNYVNDIYSSIKDQVSSLGKRGDITVTYTVRYEIQPSTKNEAKLNRLPNKTDQFGKGIQIVPGTGKYAFDSEKDANPFSGGDTNVYNDISTLSFPRFFQSVMHCATQKNCNFFLGQSQRQGYNAGDRAGGDGKCKYFNYGKPDNDVNGCPYSCVPKRAIEFSHVARDVVPYVTNYMSLYQRMSYFGIWELPPSTKKNEKGQGENTGVFYETIGLYKKVEVQVNDNGQKITWIVFDTWAVAKKNQQIAVIAVKNDGYVNSTNSSHINYSPYFGGAALLYDKACPEGFLVFCQIKTKYTQKTIWAKPWYLTESSSSSSSSGFGNTGSSETDYSMDITTVQCLEGYYWYYPLKNDGTSIKSENPYYKSDVYIEESSSGESSSSSSSEQEQLFLQHTDKDGFWFCKIEKNINVPVSNCVIIDNQEKFIGGWHPEYKDYSKIGSQFMQEIVSDESREGQGKGDYVTNGDYTPIPQSTSQEGYWVDQSGQYIIDERTTGWDQPIANAGSRESTSGPGTCISFRKSNTTTSPEGETIPPKVINGAVYSNDSAYLWERTDSLSYTAKWNEEKWDYDGGNPWFKDPVKDYDYYAPCYIANKDLLPMSRQSVHCPKCDYYLAYKYYSIKKCPWCGSELEKLQGARYLIRDEGSTHKNDPVMKKFFKLNAIGNVDVWAPAGTGVRMDAYFWRHQAQITNATKKQIYHRLGSTYLIDKGTYKFDKMSPESEMTLGFPQSIGKFQKVPYLTGSQLNNSSERYGDIKWKKPGATEKDKLTIDGMYNPIMPRHMIPEFYRGVDTGDEDEGVIAPYSQDSNDALKAVSFAQIIKLRNAVEPMYAYSSEKIYNTDYPTQRASYNVRTTADQPIIYQGRRATVKPVVLATTNSNDAYQQYYSGDMAYGNVREYFPCGYTWWNMKQVIGGRYSKLLGGQYHMDTAEGGGWASNVLYPITNRTVAKCAISIYGMLPLDKQIVKAYLLVRPSGVDPSRDPVGRSWNGGPIMYHHYHAFAQKHNNTPDRQGVSAGYMKGDYETGDGQFPHLHGTAGYPDGTYFDENGIQREKKVVGYIYMDKEVSFQDESETILWGGYSEHIEDDRNMYYDDNFNDTMTNLPGLNDCTFYRNVGTPKKLINGFNEEDKNRYWGYDENSFPDPAGWMIYKLGNSYHKKKQKYQYVILNQDKEIVQKYPQSTIWGTMTQEQIQDEIDNNTTTVEFGASAGSLDSYVSYQFTEMNSKLYQNLIPQQSQGIPGYFDMSWTNTKGYVYNDYKFEENKSKEWNAPVIFQADTPNNSGYQGGVNIDNKGTVPRCLDVTSIVRSLYNDRVSRTFHGKGGQELTNLVKWKFFTPTVASDSSVKKQNDQIEYDETYGYLLNDNCSYPELSGNIEIVPQVNSDGDKYELAQTKAELIATVTYPIIIDTSISNSYAVINENQVHLTPGRYTEYSDFENMLKMMLRFSDCKIEKISHTQIRITSDKQITVKHIPSNFNISVGTYEAVQNRIIQVTSYAEGHHPSNGKWKYSTYDENQQSFVIDLLRAPLLIKQQDWRYQEGYKDYSSCKCTNESCQAHTMNAAVAANMKGSYFDGKTNKCPLCGSNLSNQGAIDVAGDGIKTYFYDQPFEQNPLISNISFSTSNNVRVFGRNTKHNDWRLLQEYDKKTDKVIDHNLSLGKIRTRFVKFECDSSKTPTFHQYKIISYNKNQVIVEAPQGSDFSELAKVSFEQIPACIGEKQGSDPSYQEWISAKPPRVTVESSTNSEDGTTSTSSKTSYDQVSQLCNKFGYQVTILSAQVYGNDKKTMRFTFDKPYPPLSPTNQPLFNAETMTHFQVFVTKYEGEISSFKIKGIHYKSKQGSEDVEGSKDKYLLMTDVEDQLTININYNDYKYQLPQPPTQILSVWVGRNGGSVKLTGEKDNKNLRWQTEALQIDDNTSIYRIVGGNYFYDVKTGYIHIPDRDQNGLHPSAYEKSLEGTYSTLSYLPNRLILYYWSGNGKSVTMKIQADGNGPSYMLEKDAIQTIVSKLPQNGSSCDLLDVNGEITTIKQIPWLCYNHKPSTLSIERQSNSYANLQGSFKTNAGEFRAPTFGGGQLQRDGGTDQAFVDMFGKEATKCMGVCTSEITLTGAPNQIITGTITVKAQAITKKSINVGGTTYVRNERTGGIKNGFIIVQCAPVNSARRSTLCYEIPTLLIYARDSFEDEVV